MLYPPAICGSRTPGPAPGPENQIPRTGPPGRIRLDGQEVLPILVEDLSIPAVQLSAQKGLFQIRLNSENYAGEGMAAAPLEKSLDVLLKYAAAETPSAEESAIRSRAAH